MKAPPTNIVPYFAIRHLNGGKLQPMRIVNERADRPGYRTGEYVTDNVAVRIPARRLHGRFYSLSQAATTMHDVKVALAQYDHKIERLKEELKSARAARIKKFHEEMRALDRQAEMQPVKMNPDFGKPF